jgi:hypothetical protein
MNHLLKGLVVAALVTCGPASARAAAVTIDTIPGGAVDASRTVTVGDSFFVHVLLDDAADFAGFQFDVAFDATRLAATTLTSGDIFGLDTFPVASSIGAGTVTFAETTLGSALNIGAPAVLASVQFTALAAGISALTLGNVVLSDSLGDPIVIAALDDGQITIGPQAAPEPFSSVLMIGGGLAWVARRHLAGRARPPR